MTDMAGRRLITGLTGALGAELGRTVAAWREAHHFERIVILTPGSTVQGQVFDQLPLRLREARGTDRCGLFNVDIMTLTQWSRRIITTIDENVRFLPLRAALPVIAEAVNRSLDETTALRGKTDGDDPRERVNFHQAVLSELIDLKKRGETPDTVRDGGTGRFAKEIAAIYAESEAILAEAGMLDASDVLSIAAKTVRDSRGKALGDTTAIALFGFSELNVLEERLVNSFADHVESVAMFVPWIADAPVFAMSDRLVNHLRDAWHVSPETVEDPEPVPVAPLLPRLLGSRGDVIASDISIVSAPDPAQEWRDAARFVWQCMEDDSELRFADIAVVAPRVEKVRSIARDVFREAGIPVHWVRGAMLSQTVPGSSLLRLLDALSSDLSRVQVMELLTSCPLQSEWTRHDDHAVSSADWDRVARIAGVVSAPVSVFEDTWIAPLETLAARYDHRLTVTVEDLETGEVSAEGFGGPRARVEGDIAAIRSLVTLMKKLREVQLSLLNVESASGCSWREWTGVIETGWGELFDFSRIDKAPQDENSVSRVLRELASYDDLHVPFTTPSIGRKLLSDVLAQTPARGENTAEKGVWIGDFQGVAFRPSRVVIVTGLVDPEFPTERARTALAVTKPEPVTCRSVNGMTEMDTGVAEDYLSFALVMASAQSVRLSYPRADTGKETQRLPSSALLEVLAHALEPVRTSEGHALPWEEKTIQTALAENGWWLRRNPLPQPGVTHLNADEFNVASVVALCGTEHADEWIESLADMTRRGSALVQSRAGQPGPWDGLIDPDVLPRDRMLPLSASEPISPSRIETYAECPYQYFLKYLLGIEPLPEPEYTVELSPMEIGNVVHSLLAAFFRDLRGREPSPKGMDEHRTLFDAFVREAGDDITRHIERPAAVIWERQWRDIRARAWRAVEEMVDTLDTWQPWYMELRLGSRPGRDETAAIDAVTIPVEGYGEVHLHGIVDRLDRSTDQERARIVDYKSGSAKSRKKDLVNGGQSVQLLVYRVGIDQWLIGKGCTVGEVAYNYLRDESKMVGLHDEELNEAHEELREVMKAVLDGISCGGFLPVPSEIPGKRMGSCDRCDLKDVCGSLEDLAARWDGLKLHESAIGLRVLRDRAEGVQRVGEGESA
jgi:RecB family exonuclease